MKITIKIILCLILVGMCASIYAQPRLPGDVSTGVIPGRDAEEDMPDSGQPPFPPMPEDIGAVEEAPPPPPEAASPEAAAGVQGPLSDEDQVYLNVHDADIKDVIKQISKATGRNFIIDDKIRGKVTIISERPMTREEAYQTFLSALEVAGYTTVKGPANVIKVVSLKDAAKSPIPTHVDSTPYTDSFVTRLIPLENISALDMSNAIKDLVSRDGNLFAYPATNTLIITDSGSNIDRIMKIVKELDQEGPQQVMEIIPIRNAMASDIAKMVQDLFEKEKAASSARRATRGRGAEPEELDEVSKIIPDERTNSIIVLASKRAIENVRNIINKLDTRLSAADEGRIHVYYLKHAKAKEMAETLSSLTAAAGTAKGGKGTDIAVARFEGDIKVTADESTNALIVTALPKDFQTLIEKVVSKLDIPRRQVYFEAVVMEMTLTKGLDYGVQAFGGAGVGGSMIGMGQTLGGPSLLGNLFSGATPWPGILGGLMSSRTTNVTYVGADGTTQTLTMPAFSAFLSALANRGEANVVATPNLLTLDNEEATMAVLTKEPTPGSTTFTSAATTTQSVDYKEAGLELKIKPQITEGDMVLLEIEQKLSGFTTPQYSTNLNAPAMRERSVKTTVVTENGQTVVLAGLMDDFSEKRKQKVPLLGDIPVLGILFSTTSNNMRKSNLMIFITPHIIKDRTDFSAILKRKIEERNKFIDSNFSKSRRRVIRDTIAAHSEDLLEFREPIELEPTTAAPPAAKGSQAQIKSVPTVPAARPLAPVKPTYTPAPLPPARQPVITVPQGETSMRQPQYQTSPVVEQAPPADSSAWRPIEPPKTVEKAPKKVILPPPAVKEEKPPEEASSKLPKWMPSKEEAAAKKTPSGTVEEKIEEKVEIKEKVYKEPAPGSRNGELDLAY